MSAKNNRGIWYLVAGFLALIGAAFVHSYIDRLVNLMSVGLFQDSVIALLAILPFATLLVIGAFMVYKWATVKDDQQPLPPTTNEPPTILVRVDYSEGPRRFHAKASAAELLSPTIRDRAIDIRDILVLDSIVDRRFEHCVLFGPATILAVGTEHDRRRPFTHCTWDSARWAFFETQEALGTFGAIQSVRTFYENCEFRGIKFRLLESEVRAIKAEAGE